MTRLRTIDKMWMGGGAAGSLMVIAIGWFFFISPQHAQANDYRAQTSEAVSRNDLLLRKLSTLREQSKKLDEYKATLTRDQSALPSESGLPNFLRQLQTLGGATQVSITTVTIAPPTPMIPAPAGTVANATTAPTNPTTPTAKSSAISSIAVTLNASGRVEQLGMFLDQLQHVQPRAVLISQADLKPASETGSTVTASGQTTLALSISLFVEAGR